MPHYLGIGVHWERIMESCPKELEPYDIAHINQIKERDMLMHAWFENYGVCAISVAISHCLNKNSNAKFIKEPILSHWKEKEEALSEADKIQKTKQLFARLDTMKTNFELLKPER